MIWTRQNDLDQTKIIWTVQIWLCTNPFGQVQKIISTRQNNLDLTKTIWT